MLLKRFVRVVATCGLLTAGYFGYCQAFAVLAARIGTPDWRVIPYDPSPSKTHIQTIDLARSTFGNGHWTSDPKKAICYYDTERGYWIFFQRYARKNGGQRIEFSPFAIIWGSKGKKNHNTLQGDLAYVDFDRPFDLVNKPGTESARIVRAMIEGQVRLRDDKGTRENPGDDLTIGPLLSVTYDEATHRIRSDSPFELRERDVVATATGLTIELIPNPAPPGKPPGATSGFSGAKTVWLHQDIRIFCENVGRVGVVPGGKQASDGERRAGDLRCDGPAQFNMPLPKPKDAPPGPPEPVVALFFRNVVVRQGPLVTSSQAGMTLGNAADPPDQLNADMLELKLFPAPRESAPATDPTATATATADPNDAPTGGQAQAMAGLTLREAVATGHAVWLQSPSEGLEARGNELRYEKRQPEQPDRIFFRGNRETKVEKISHFAKGPRTGEIEAVDTLHTLDVTIYLASRPGETPTLIARGPGSMQTRPGRNLPVERSAEWGDKLIVQTVETSAGPRRRITLTGTPKVISPTQGTITANDRIVAYLKPKERAATQATTGDAKSPSEAFQIDWVEGHGGVHMAAVPPEPGAKPAEGDGLPGSSRTLEARKTLYVVFTEPPAAPADAATATPPAKPDAPAESTPKPDPNANKNANASAPPRKPEPALSVSADEVWARVLLGSLHAKPELQEVRLRKNVKLHQDPAPGKEKGTDATGEAIDFVNRGEGRAWLEAHGGESAPARVVTDTFLIEGPKLGVDQAADFAWVKGAGRMVQDGPKPESNAPAAPGAEVVPTVFLDDDPASKEASPAAKTFKLAKGPVVITWRQEMQFYGQPADTPEHNAWALFLGDVKVKTPESSLSCGQMKAFLDGPVEFQRPNRPKAPNAPPEERRERPRIATVRCLKNVDLVHRQMDETGKVFQQKGRVVGSDVSYSLATGRFAVEGAGIVWLYRPEGQDDAVRGPLATPAPPEIQRTSATFAQGESNEGAGRTLFGGNGARARQGNPLDVTRVAFQKRVVGRVGNGDSGTPETSDTPFFAEFQGGVQVINAPIGDENADLDPDDPPTGFMMLTSETLKVIRELPSATQLTAEGDPAEQFFIDATGDPQALAPPRSIKGDRITYDSLKELVYVYGDEGGVSIINQDGVGQPFSASRGRAVMYNRKSGRIELIDPKNVLLIDPRSGIRERPRPPGALQPPGPRNIPRSPLRAIPGNDKERRGFNGR